jgi:hypothetical protein
MRNKLFFFVVCALLLAAPGQATKRAFTIEDLVQQS